MAMSENNSKGSKKITSNESRSLIGSRTEVTSTTNNEMPATSRPKKK